MGRLFIHLDPPGAYDRLDEPGADFRFSGSQLAAKLTDSKDGSHPGDFWVPPGTEWLLPRPLHHNPGWYRDTRMTEHVIRKADWTFGVNVTGTEYPLSRTPDGQDYNPNQAIQVYVGSAPPLDNKNFTAMGAAGKIDIPADMRVVAFANKTPTNRVLGSSVFHPFLKILQYPEPYEWVAFGWGNLALVLGAGGKLFLFRSPNNDGQKWELLPTVNGRGGAKVGSGRATDFLGDWNLGVPTGGAGGAKSPREYEIACHPIGLDHLYVDVFGTAPFLYRLRNSDRNPTPDALFPAGAWWWASPLETHFGFQCQIVGYNTASTDTIDTDMFAFSGEHPRMFQLGKSYKPTLEPDFVPTRLMNPTDSNVADIIQNGVGNEWDETLKDDNERVIVGVRDESYNAWVSNGTHSEGSFRIVLQPGTIRAGAPYLAPQLQAVTLKFPPKRTPRPTSELILSDKEFFGLKVETSLREVLGKRLTFQVRERDLELLDAARLRRREGYGVHVLEDELGDGVIPTMTLRARGWVYEVGLSEAQSEAADDTPAPLRMYTIAARGLLTRLNEQWSHLPVVVNPSGEKHIEHDFAVKDTFRKSAFDVDDTELFYWHPDPFAGTAIARLPGTEADLSGTPGSTGTGAWHPDWTEERIKYVERIAAKWRDWVFYESGTRLLYHPHLVSEVEDGFPYHVAAIIYRSTAEAKAASVDPKQRFLERPEAFAHRLPCNVIRITGKDPARNLANPDQAIHMIDRNRKSIEDVNARGFIGEERVYSEVSKLAVGARGLRQAARVLLRRRARSSDGWIVRVERAPWQFQPDPLEVGYCTTLQGRGDHLIIHMVWEPLGPDLIQTTLTCEELPAGATAGDTAWVYPGSAEVAAEGG